MQRFQAGVPFLGFLAICLLLAPPAPVHGASRGSNVPPRQEFEGTVIAWTLVPLATRGATLNLLVGRPQGVVKRAVLLFPGGKGAGMFRKREDGFRLLNNSLVRNAPRFAREGFVAAIVDAPSDHASGMSDAFRTGTEHLTDVQAAVEHLAKEGIQEIHLVGTSRGTLSVAYLATQLKHPRVKGYVLTSGMDSVASMPLDEIAAPVLVVHHTEDACQVTTYAGARAAYARLAKSTRKHFISVSGGDTPISGPCAPLHAHGFLGKETEVVRAIAQWMRGEAAPSWIKP